MPVMIALTSAEHGGRTACGTHKPSTCGTGCECGCPYTAMHERGCVEDIVDVEQRYPDEWLGFVIPPDEDEFAPERGMLIVHSVNDEEVWDAITRVTHNQVVHVYFNGTLDKYLQWTDSAVTTTAAPDIPVIPLLPR